MSSTPNIDECPSAVSTQMTTGPSEKPLRRSATYLVPVVSVTKKTITISMLGGSTDPNDERFSEDDERPGHERYDEDDIREGR